MIINLTEQITQAQIAFALVVIAGALVFFVSKYGEKVNREKGSKRHSSSKH